MANSYKKIYLHIIMAVKARKALLHKDWRDDVFKYIAGIVNKRGHFSLAVNGVEDHVHFLIDYKEHELIRDLVREIKKASTKYINEQGYSNFHFQWQSGYGVFSVGYSQIDTVIKYILNQEEHHKSKSFKKEYLATLKSNDIEFNEKYVFQFNERKEK